MNRRQFLATTAAGAASATAQTAPPNIVWITGDDLGPQLSCYGHPIVKTPNIDRLALEGCRFTHCFTAAPVCSPSRSAFNTGMYQIAIDAQNHRSHRKDGAKLPAGVKLVSQRLREAGYFTANVLEFAPGYRGIGKTDFNFNLEGKPYDGTHWRQRKSGQPFFAHINFIAPHKGVAFTDARKQKDLVDPKTVDLPPYYADHPVIRDEVANYYDAIHLLDKQVGALLAELEKDGVLDNSLVLFFGDNGRCLLRGKQWLYEAGLHVPLIIRWPGHVKPGTVRDELVSAIDWPATSLWAAGVKLPENMHGRPLLGPQAKPRDYIFGARDRCDMTVDRIRSVRDKRYKYIRNYMPERPYTQYNGYIKASYPTLTVMQELHKAGKLKGPELVFMADRKPPVEFHDLSADPHEINNLAESPKHKKLVAKYAAVLDKWLADMQDKGATPESEASKDGGLGSNT